MEPQKEYGWTNVDGTSDPKNFADYLNTVTALDTVQAYKRKTYLLLGAEEGHRILDIGCGTGDDVRALAQIVGKTGQVIGIDNSHTMIQEARTKQENDGLNVDFEVGDALGLDFADNTFDGCRCDRVFQRLPDRTRALAEMIRVTKSGGRICLGDTDWGTLVVDMPDIALTNRILEHSSNRMRNGWSGRQLHRLCKEAGLLDLTIDYATALFTNFEVADQVLYLNITVNELKQSGRLSAEEGERWIGYLKEADQGGYFFSALSRFVVSSRKS